MRKNIFILVIAVTLLAGCAQDTTNPNTAEAVTFVLEITDNEGEIYTLHGQGLTGQTVGDIMVQQGFIADDEYITVIRGVEADWDTDNAYWAFYIDGEFAMTGAFITPIKEGVTYAFVYTQA